MSNRREFSTAEIGELQIAVVKLEKAGLLQEQIASDIRKRIDELCQSASLPSLPTDLQWKIPEYCLQKIPREKYDMLSRPIKILNIGKRWENCLCREGIQTLADLLGKDPKDLLEERGIGEYTIMIIDSALQRLGITGWTEWHTVAN